jgi:hypothetical protein
VSVGEPVVAIGNPIGLEYTVSTGIVSGIRQRAETFKMLQMTTPISPGSSGGPIIDEHGAVVGVATATIEAGQNLNFAVPARYLRALLHAPRPMSLAEFAAATRRAPASDLPPPPPAPPEHAPGRVSLERVTPGAVVILVRDGADGKKIQKRIPEALWSKPPLELNISAGERWTLVATLPGYEDFVRDLVFPAGTTELIIRIELAPKRSPRP